MDRSRVSSILADWDAVAGEAKRPAAPPRGVVVRSGLPGGMLAPAALALVAVLAVVLLARGPDGLVGGGTPVSPGASAAPVATPTPTTTPAPTAVPTATPSPTASPAPTPGAATPSPTLGRCDADTLAARITMWEGAAGNRIATIELTNAGPLRCTLPTMERPQLIDGTGRILIDGKDPTTTSSLTLEPGEKLTTLVDDSNYCGAAPVAPVTVAFVLVDGSSFTAEPFSPTDATVPPCNGSPGSAGSIEMQPWSR